MIGVLVLQTESPEVVVKTTFDYDNVSLRVRLTAIFSVEGCFHAKVAFNGVTLHNGDFDCIVLSCEFHTL